MKLAEIILENERNKQDSKNRSLVRIRLKELVYAYPSEVAEVLQKTGVAVSAVLPPSVLFAVVIKHIASNSELREVISKMLLELDGYASADGQGWQLIGGAVSAIGSVLSGIGRGQGQQTMSEAQIQQMQIQKQQEQEEKEARAKKTRNIVIVIAVSAVIIVGIILLVRHFKKAKIKAELNASQGSLTNAVAP